jgi:hypothetical protein
MSINLDCFDNIIGLSRTACACYEAVPTKISNSGLYLDELSGLRRISSLLNCETGSDIWNYFSNARDQAILSFKGDFNGLAASQYALRRKPFYGKIGKQKNTKTLDTLTTGNYVGVRLKCANIVSGELVLNKVTTLMNSVGAITLYIYNNLNELVDSVSLTTSASVTENNITNITLPLENSYADNMEYFLIFKLDGTIYPKNNENFDTSNSFYRSKAPDRTYGWGDYLTVEGVNMSDISDLSDINGTSSCLMYGLILDITLRCKIGELLCKDSLDFEANPLAMVLSHTVRYKAASLLLQDILRSPQLNIDTITNKDQVRADIDTYEEKYEGLLSYIVDNVDITNNDCFMCKHSMGVDGILS